MKLAIQFGAGAIGRGLLGKLLHDSGYHVLFVDVYKPTVDKINEDGYFTVEYTDHDGKRENLENVSALASTDEDDLEEIYEKIGQADIITTSVRVENLESTSKILAKGLEMKDKDSPKVDIMAFENAFRATDLLKGYIVENSKLSEGEIEELATFPNTVTDRIVQNKEEDGKLIVEISDDFEAVIEKPKLKDPESEPIDGAEYTKDIDQELERKLFLVNGVHAATAYFGYQKGYEMMDKAFGDPEIMEDIRGLIKESSEILIKEYGFDRDQTAKFSESKLNRFLKTASHDTVERVARDPVRKLGDTDRLVAPAKRAYKEGLGYDHLAKAIAYAYAYDEKTDEKAQEIQNFIKENSIEEAIEKYSNIDKENYEGLFDKIVEEYKKI